MGVSLTRQNSTAPFVNSGLARFPLFESRIFGTGRFHIYNENGGEVNILGCFKGLKPGGSGEVAGYYEYEGERRPLRFCVLRKSEEAERKGPEALEKTRMRKYGNKELSKARRAYNRYVIWEACASQKGTPGSCSR